MHYLAKQIFFKESNTLNYKLRETFELRLSLRVHLHRNNKHVINCNISEVFSAFGRDFCLLCNQYSFQGAAYCKKSGLLTKTWTNKKMDFSSFSVDTILFFFAWHQILWEEKKANINLSNQTFIQAYWGHSDIIVVSDNTLYQNAIWHGIYNMSSVWMSHTTEIKNL